MFCIVSADIFFEIYRMPAITKLARALLTALLFAPVFASGEDVVIPDEQRQARWVRQVKELEIVRAGSGTTP
jgi:hypothetical protein